MFDDYHSTHCDHCFSPTECGSDKCHVISCPLKCGFRLHECKLSEHLAETCPQADVACVNESNGCRERTKRCHMSQHLSRCCANVVHCSSFRMRKIANRKEKSAPFKHPDPIRCEHRSDLTNLNDILLKQDYEKLRQFSEQCALKFQRMYGYLIGLKLNPNSSEFRLSFLNLLLKTVKSRVFSDIEAENCIVFNDDLGCSACQTRIKYMEMDRFQQLKKDRYHFDFILSDVFTYEDFIEKKIHKNLEFLNAYEKFYLKPNREEKLVDVENNYANETKEDLERKLNETNKQLIESIELDPVMKLNVAKELPCDAFQKAYESYRINDSHFSVDCNQMLRRDEFADHYNLYHNFIFNNAELIDKKCPFSQYGCTFFKSNFDFMFTNSFDSSQNLDSHLLNARLTENKLVNEITFELANLNSECVPDLNYSLVELPLDVLFEIFNKLDSLSLYTLSLTCKVS